MVVKVGAEAEKSRATGGRRATTADLEDEAMGCAARTDSLPKDVESAAMAPRASMFVGGLLLL